MVNLGNGDIEPAFEPACETFNDASLFLERIEPVQMQLRRHHADYHNLIL
jgi:hypothetical protein